MLEYFEKLSELLKANIPFVQITIVDAIGSVPQEISAKMLVVQDGLYYGTVGGGKIEARSIKEAQELLASKPKGTDRTKFVNWSLDRDIGMTCGGSVKLYFEAFNLEPWRITVFGAGHCSEALINLLLTLNCHLTCVDPRPEWISRLPDSPKLKKVVTENMPAYVASIPQNAFVVLMTMGHTTDKPILLEILRRWDETKFPYLGVIGSKAKAVRLKRDVDEAGLPAELSNVFMCPVGLELGTNEPHEIAISIAAQMLQYRDRLGLQTAGAKVDTANADFGCMEPSACVE